MCLGPVGLTRLLRNSVLVGTLAACTPDNDACETAACITDRLVQAAPGEVDAIVDAIPDVLTRVEALGAALTKRPELSERLCRHLPHGISKHRCDVAADRRHLWVPLDSTPDPVVRAGSGPARSGWTNASVPESSWAQEYRPATECRGEIDSASCVWSRAVQAATEGEADAAARWCSGLPRGSVWRADCFFQAAELLVERSGRSQLDAALDFCGGAGSFRGRCAASVMATLAATAPPSTVGDVVRWAPQLMTMHAMRDWFDDPVMRRRTEDRYTAMMVFAAVGKATEASGDALDGLPSQAAVHIRAALSHRLITQQTEATTLEEAMSMVAAALERRVASDRYADVQAPVVADLWPKDREGESHLAAVSYLGHSRRTVANDPETDTAICVLEAAARAHPAWEAVLEEAKEHPDERVRWTAVRLVEQLEARRLGTEAAQWAPEHAVQTRDL